ncbi:MAG TPA: hypothetical protein VKT50_08190 [Candidatus Acidoferrales bacterium]|nr:hypothetical protein [Candidatus Acidoferrales bacterium]
MPVQAIPYLLYADLNSSIPANSDEFQALLQTLPRNGMLRVCSAINAVIAGWNRKHDFQAQKPLISAFLQPAWAEKAILLERPVFHRHQLLFTAKEALKYCRAAEETLTPRLFHVGKALLMASDQLNSGIPKTSSALDQVAAIIHSFVPVMEANRHSNYVNTIARGYFMNTDFIEPLRDNPDFVDAPRVFENSTGIPLEHYFAMLFGCLSRFADTDIKNFDKLLIPSTWFRTTKIPTSQVDAFYKETAATPEELRSNAMAADAAREDFVIFQDKPLIQDSNGCFPMDMTYLADKFYNGPFWRVNFALPSDDRESFHRFWGHVFEHYLNWLFAQSCKGKANWFLQDPRYAADPSEQVCDGLIVCDRQALLIEYKGSTFRSTSKYGTGIDAIKNELEQKLVTSDDNPKKGVRQLASAVERLCRYENPESIQGVDLSGITTIFPVMIIRDEIGSALGMNAYLNERFQSYKAKRLWRSVTPLFCLSVDDIETLTGYLRDVSLAALLSSWYKKDKRLVGSFWFVENDLIKKAGLRKPPFVKTALERIGQNAASILGLKPPEELK